MRLLKKPTSGIRKLARGGSAVTPAASSLGDLGNWDKTTRTPTDKSCLGNRGKVRTPQAQALFGEYIHELGRVHLAKNKRIYIYICRPLVGHQAEEDMFSIKQVYVNQSVQYGKLQVYSLAICINIVSL